MATSATVRVTVRELQDYANAIQVGMALIARRGHAHGRRLSCKVTNSALMMDTSRPLQWEQRVRASTKSATDTEPVIAGLVAVIVKMVSMETTALSSTALNIWAECATTKALATIMCFQKHSK
jgi:hypothetical protein